MVPQFSALPGGLGPTAALRDLLRDGGVVQEHVEIRPAFWVGTFHAFHERHPVVVRPHQTNDAVKVLCQARVADISSEPLVVLRPPIALLVSRVALPQLSDDAWCEARGY